MRRSLLRLVSDQLRPGDLLAFYRTSGGTGASQVFSSDPLQIEAAVRMMRWTPPVFALENPMVFTNRFSEAMRALSTLPGRKAIVCLNSGVASFDPLSRMHFPFDVGPEFMRGLADEANRGSITVSAVDTRGLPVEAAMPGNWFALSQSQGFPYTGLAPEKMNRERYFSSQSFSTYLTSMTGGLFLHDRNDIYDQIKTVVQDDDKGYYLLGWDPGSEAFKRKRGIPVYHRLRIKVQRAGLAVRSRAGFFGRVGTPTQLPPGSTAKRMMDILVSPFSSGDIDLDLHATFQHNDKLGSYIESLIHVGPRNLSFQQEGGGCASISMELLTLARPLEISSEGTGTIDSQITTIHVCGKSVADVQKDGFVYIARSRVARPGPYEMRVAVRTASEHAASSIGPKKLILRDCAGDSPGVIGSARQPLEAPDVTKKLSMLVGLTLELSNTSVPQPIPAQTQDENFEAWYRPVVPGDPAVREFHKGEELSYRSTVVGGAESAAGEAVEATVFYEGTRVATFICPIQNSGIAGTYTVPNSALPGQYALELSLPQHGRDQASTQWVNFSIMN